VKNNNLHTVFSVVLIVIILLPFTIQTVHTLHNHEYIICNANDVKHIDQHTVNCGSFHRIIQQNSIDFSSEFEFEIGSLVNFIPLYFYENEHSVIPLQFASRAPPCFIV